MKNNDHLGLRTALPFRSSSRVLIASLLICSFAAAAYVRNASWHDETSVLEDAVSKNPNNARAHYNLGLSFGKTGNIDAAIREYHYTLFLDPRVAAAHNNLGMLYQKQGRRSEALREYQAALNLDPSMPEAHNNLGLLFEELGRLREALYAYQAAVYFKPNYSKARINLEMVLDKIKHTDQK